jgi:hypothetical protein
MDYETDRDISPNLILDGGGGFPSWILPKRALLYRGITKKAQTHEWIGNTYNFPTDGRPLFFGLKPYTAMRYSTSTCSVFEVLEEIRLLDVFHPDTLKTLSMTLQGEELQIFQLVTGYGLEEVTDKQFPNAIGHLMGYKKRKNKAVKNQEGYFQSADKEKRLYTDARFALIVCALGYDGWVVFDNEVDVVDMNEFDELEIFPRSHHEEVVLCKPANLLRYKPSLTCLNAGEYERKRQEKARDRKRKQVESNMVEREVKKAKKLPRSEKRRRARRAKRALAQSKISDLTYGSGRSGKFYNQ